MASLRHAERFRPRCGRTTSRAPQLLELEDHPPKKTGAAGHAHWTRGRGGGGGKG